MKTKTIFYGAFLVSIVLVSFPVFAWPPPPCPGCQTRWPSDGQCHDDDSKCPRFCVNASCVECQETEHCGGCQYCNSSWACAPVSVATLYADEEVVCVGYTDWFSATTSPGGYTCQLVWQHEGAAESGSICGSSWARWTSPGTYTVTASCGSSSQSKTITVVGVTRVDAEPNAVCVNDLNGILFTAVPYPSGSMNCIVWERRFKANSSDAWSDWYGCGAHETTNRLPTDEPGFYQVRAKNGINDEGAESDVVKVVKVDLVAQPHVQPFSPLVAGRICANAQQLFREAPWKAIVKPGGTTATVAVSGPVSGGGTVSDNSIFYVESIDEDQVGVYTVTITHDDCGDCPVQKNETVFKFIFDTYRYPDGDSGASSPPCSQHSTASGYANAKADESALEGHEYGAKVIWCYRVKVLDDPLGSYEGSVKARAIVNYQTTGSMILRNGPPANWLTVKAPSINLTFDIISASVAANLGLVDYGSSLAGANISSVIADGEEFKCATVSHNWNEVGLPFPIWGVHYKYKMWDDTGLLELHEDINRTYSVGSPVSLNVKASASASISQLIYFGPTEEIPEQILRSPVVLDNTQHISTVEVYEDDGVFEIPVN